MCGLSEDGTIACMCPEGFRSTKTGGCEGKLRILYYYYYYTKRLKRYFHT